MTLGADQYLADGSTPLQAIVELRTGDALPADGFAAGRLSAYTLVDGAPYAGGIASFARRGPGVWLATVQLESGLGGSSLTIGATLDGVDIVAPRSLPIAADVWDASYLPSVRGGCAASGLRAGAREDAGAAMLFGIAVAARRRRRALRDSRG